MIDYTEILIRHFNAQWTLNGDDYEGLTWLSDSPKPTKQELDALWPSVLSALQTEKEETEAKQKAALSKLAALGIDADDLKALGL